ncbi:MAG: Crp/Fnr family transcriptional regulator [Gammaproteobacteria bacterium]|nr:Crp/Fnr family transcriptional regulator [Gammaproteobacteria bacterium]
MSDAWVNLFDGAAEETFNSATPLFRRDDFVRAIYFVRVGQIKLVRVLPDGTELTLHVAQQGSPVAEASLFAENYHCDAECGAHTILAVLPKDTVRRALETNDLAFQAMQRAAIELQELRTRIEIMRLRRLNDRLDAYLALKGTPEPGRWVSVADWIGVTPPALYRELARRRSKQQ